MGTCILTKRQLINNMYFRLSSLILIFKLLLLPSAFGQLQTGCFWTARTNQIYWGEGKNGLKAGLDFLIRTNVGSSEFNKAKCQVFLQFQTNAATIYIDGVNSNAFVSACINEYYSLTTTNADGLVCFVTCHSNTFNSVKHSELVVSAETAALMPQEKNIRLKLSDENGVDVARTELGEKSWRTFIDNPVFVLSRWGYKTVNVGAVQQFSGTFYLDDYFTITKPGKYHLQMRLRLFRRAFPNKYNGVTTPLYLPPVDVEFEIHTNMLKSL